ncbi:hypothetical protein Sjap_007151 [Stephania japonica]|uniref:non-specific serine/threonine protein kinase n=1 Tax=Stephania japonica TaxID=461633 RepID=A0AAP0JM69_9MAGN
MAISREAMAKKKKKRVVVAGKYEVGRTLGEGNFGKVKYAENVFSGEAFAIKILDKNIIITRNSTDWIMREISALKLLKHPNIVRLHELLASKTKIYMVLECVSGGQLFDIESEGRFSESKSRKLFQQLIDGLSYCHEKGVYHRDLKLENILIDARGNVKISDFGLTALPQHFRVMSNRGYDGAVSDVWSCGVILYALLTASLPFDDRNLVVLYQKAAKGKTNIPNWLSPGAQNLISRILDPNPATRITIAEIKEDDWFNQDYIPLTSHDDEEIEDSFRIKYDVLADEGEMNNPCCAPINAFELIGTSPFLNLSGFFETENVFERKINFISNHSPRIILEKIEDAIMEMGLTIEKINNGKVIDHDEDGATKHGSNEISSANSFSAGLDFGVGVGHKTFLPPQYQHDMKGVERSKSIVSVTDAEDSPFSFTSASARAQHSAWLHPLYYQ